MAGRHYGGPEFIAEVAREFRLNDEELPFEIPAEELARVGAELRQHLRRNVQREQQPTPPPPPPQAQAPIEADEEEDEEDHNLMRNMRNVRVPPPTPAPHQLRIFQHCMDVGFFVAAIETFNDREENDYEELKKFAIAKAEELIDKSGEIRLSAAEEAKLCGTPKVIRDLKRIARNVDYFKELMEKFITEFDGDNMVHVTKLRRATGFIKGVMVLQGAEVYNDTNVHKHQRFDMDVEIYLYNMKLFLKFLKQYKDA